MLQFDTTVHLSDVVMVGGGLVAFVTMFVQLRDAIRDLKNAVGTKDPAMGLLGDMEDVKTEQRMIRDWVISMRGRRTYDNLIDDRGPRSSS